MNSIYISSRELNFAHTLFPYTTLFRSASISKANFSSVKAAAGPLKLITSGSFICGLLPATIETLLSRINSRLILSLRSEEHTSELQSRGHLVCRLLLEKKNNYNDS